MHYTGKRVVRFEENKNFAVPPRPAASEPERSKPGCGFTAKALQYAAEQTVSAGGRRRDAVCCANIFLSPRKEKVTLVL